VDRPLLVGNHVLFAQEELVWIVTLPKTLRHLVVGLDDEVATVIPPERLNAVGRGVDLIRFDGQVASVDYAA
jgi:hypothetical protein